MNGVTKMRQDRGLGRDGLRIPDRIARLFQMAAETDRRACVFLVAFCLLAFLPGFFSIPVVDRDEARFAQATRQMLATGDFTDLRLGAEGRRTSAFGLHWLQAGIVGFADVVGVPQATQAIAFYRLPSLAAAIGAALLTFWAALIFVGRPAALFAGLLLASSASLGVLARLATPDALMVAAVAGAMGAAGRLYRTDEGEADGPPALLQERRRLVVIFWGAATVGALFKGLLPLLLIGLALLSLGAVERRWRQLSVFLWWPGLVVCVLLITLWVYLRHFLPLDNASSARGFLLGRMAPPFMGFGAPPGAYLLMFWALFWPAAPLAALALPILWKARRLRTVRFLAAWVVPAWLVLELLPTKVPVYVVPTFPALAILVSLAVERGALALRNMRLSRLLWLWPLIGALIAVGALLALAILDRTTSFLAWPLLLWGFFALITAAVSVREYGVEKASLLGIAGMLVAGFGVMQLILPRLDSVWVSPRLVEIASTERCAAADPATISIGSAGFNEPSLAFLAPGDVRYMDGAGAAEFLAEGGCRAVFVERRQEARFVRRAESLGLRIQRGADVHGLDYNEARRVRLSLYRRAD